jgi:hypothetical protein
MQHKRMVPAIFAIAAPLSKIVNGEAGYMNQHLFVTSGSDENIA